MIECPICHVMNEDAAHFCSECGQRFNQPGSSSVQAPSFPGAAFPPPEMPPPMPPPQPPQIKPTKLEIPQPGQFGDFQRPAPPQPEPERPAPPKPHLRSPLLGGDDFDDEEPPVREPGQKPKSGLRSPLLAGDDEPAPRAGAPKGKAGGLRSPLLGGDDADDEPPQPSSGKRKGLRSPLLSGDDEVEDHPAMPRGRRSQQPSDDEGPRPYQPKGGLRSPLLGGDSDDDEPRGGAPRGKGGLRSPLLRGDDVDDDSSRTPFPHRSRPNTPQSDDNQSPRPYPPKGGLRSPLLGGGDDDYEDEPPARGGNRFASNTGGRPRLHSPVLGGGGQNFDDFEEDEPYDEDDPNILRSPLLAAKSKLPQEKPAPKPAPPAPAPQAPQTPQLRQAPTTPMPQVQQPANPPAPPEYGWGIQQQQGTPPDPYNMQGSPQPTASQPNANWPGVQGQFAQPGTAGTPTPGAPRSPESYADTPPKPIPAYKQQVPEPAPSRGRPSGRTAALDDDAPPPRSKGPSFDRLSQDSGGDFRQLRSGPALVLLIPCVFALIIRGMFLMDVFKTNYPATYIADQVAQTVVILSLIIFALTANKKL